jgi:hypothetical protein
MVTTVNDVAATLLGDYDIDIAAVTSQEWISLIHKTIAKLNLRHTRGFKPAHVLCEYSGAYGLKRIVPQDVRQNGRMHSLELGHIVAPPHEWKNFPAQTAAVGTPAIGNPSITQMSILVDRQGILHLLNVDWDGREEEPSDPRTWDHYPPVRSAVATRLRAAALCDQELTDIITKYPRMVPEIFGSFWRALSTSNGEIQAMLSHAERMEVLVERIHMATWRLGQQS